jgi:hypothetical protein
MKRITAIAVVVGYLLVAVPARGETIAVRVTPDKSDGPFTTKAGGRFTIKVARVTEKDKGDFFDFRVTVKSSLPDVFISGEPKPKTRPFVDVSIPGEKVQVTGQGRERTFSFLIAAKDIEKATFTYDDNSPPFEGYYYWIYLRDFVPSR